MAADLDVLAEADRQKVKQHEAKRLGFWGGEKAVAETVHPDDKTDEGDDVPKFLICDDYTVYQGVRPEQMASPVPPAKPAESSAIKDVVKLALAALAGGGLAAGGIKLATAPDKPEPPPVVAPVQPDGFGVELETQ